TSGSVDKNTKSLQDNQKAQVSVTGGLIGLGISASALLSPLTAASAGFSAFAATAVPSVRKIAGALTGPGGLNAAWSTLDKQQRSAALSVQTLGAQYSKLATAMEPQVFQVFNAGLTLADSLLGPVSELASKAADGVESLVTQ